MRLALKKTARPTLFGPITHFVGQRLDHTIYSHCEIVFTNHLSASSVIGEGVRFKDIRYQHPGAWDFWTLPDEIELDAYRWFKEHAGEPYDYMGMLRFGLSILGESPRRWSCTEAFGAAVGWREPWRLGPGGVLARCQDEFSSVMVASPWTIQRP